MFQDIFICTIYLTNITSVKVCYSKHNVTDERL